MRATTRQIHLDGDRTVPPLPVHTLVADEPGPTVIVTANIHGDETTGLAAASALVEQLRDGALTRGTTIVFPTLNPAGLAASTRAVPGDGGDLNRSFPGKRRGRTSERLAARIWDELTTLKPDVVVDLHADAAASIPYALLDRPVSLTGAAARRMKEELERLGSASGLTVVREYPPDLYLRYALDRSLAEALVNRPRVPAITVESGPRRILDPAAVTATAGAVRNILVELGLCASGPGPHPTRVQGGPLRRHAAPRCQTAGWLEAVVAPGQPFGRGDLLARIRSPGGAVLEQIQASRTGIVLSWIEATWLTAGTVTGTLAVREGR